MASDTPIIHVTDQDLCKNKYDIKTLEENFVHLNSKIVLRTQILTADFCVKYLLNDDYASCVEDTYYFCKDVVLRNQPHITESELKESVKKFGYIFVFAFE